MTSNKLIAIAALAALGLAACDNTGRGAGAASGICKPFTTAAQTTTTAPSAIPGASPGVLPAAGDPSANLDDCLHRWGYTLAASSDAANFVADATLAACSTALSAWNQQSLSVDNGGGALQAPSLMTGQPTNPLAEHHAFAEQRALFYVVQARAGHCGPPPAATSTTNR
ncbi:MAG: hypothetical protein JWP49_2735 [Phenylobacterium sp.]|jgi:hypothetical protein|nr:hypothetical protein [Phenylobacterium sp.]